MAKDWLATVWVGLPDQSPPQSQSPVRDEDGFCTQFRAMVAFAQDCQDAEAEYLKNPGDADNLKKWGVALRMLAFDCEDEGEKQMLHEDAIKKFKMALDQNPDDLALQLEWVKARLQITYRKGDDDTEYDELYKLFQRLHEGSRSAASLAAMSYKAVEEEKSSKRRKKIVGTSAS